MRGCATPVCLHKSVTAYARISLSTWQVSGADEAKLLHELPEPLRAEICDKCVGGSLDSCVVLAPALAGDGRVRRTLLRGLEPALYMDGEVLPMDLLLDLLRLAQT